MNKERRYWILRNVVKKISQGKVIDNCLGMGKIVFDSKSSVKVIVELKFE